jgi:tRNA pseudouridine38-40 synthase
MQRFKISVSYDGTAYYGWQVQPKDVSIQSSLEGVLRQLSGETVKVHGSGRTDQGVHARRQVAHFDLEKSFTAKKLRTAMNALLPVDIRVHLAEKVDSEFHARWHTTSKQYRYLIWNSSDVPPFLRLYRSHVRTSLDVDAMSEAAAHLLGEHDFTAFTANSNDVVDNPVRKLTRLDVTKKGSEIVIIAEGNGFLYKMVRSLAGFLIKVGKGVAPPAEAAEVLASGKRTEHVQTAPPEGLFLWKVNY